MKSNLTISIERLLKFYNPVHFDDIKVNMFRPRFVLPEFPVECGTISGGIVDMVFITEYFKTIETYKSCKLQGWSEAYPEDCPMRLVGDITNVKRCTAESCKWHYDRTEGEPKVLFVCCEIKTSKADFMSKNGHNFVGNLNYYVMPIDLYNTCKQDIPDDIGVIALTSNNSGLRRVKNGIFKEVSTEQEKWFLLTALKVQLREYKKEETRKLQIKQRAKDKTIAHFKEEEWK